MTSTLSLSHHIWGTNRLKRREKELNPLPKLCYTDPSPEPLEKWLLSKLPQCFARGGVANGLFAFERLKLIEIRWYSTTMQSGKRAFRV